MNRMKNLETNKNRAAVMLKISGEEYAKGSLILIFCFLCMVDFFFD